MEDKNNVPTLLIGLGGIGSEIVNKIYEWIPEDRRGRIGIHAMDTDVNTILKHKNLTGKVTQTSTDWTVGKYIANDSTVRSWFPENPQLMKKTLTDGAGQIRAVSRLAFRSAIGSNKLEGLHKEISSIFQLNSSAYDYSVRVMIICSLAGGTGSGIFLQTAMYLREILEQKFGQSNVLVRGAFLLPDVFINTNIIDKEEWENIRANGYASLKELDAITQNACGDIQNGYGVTIELEYRPNQVNLNGQKVHAITSKQLPYDFCFLYDYENMKGLHLNSKDNYIDQAARSIFLQLFSPISSRSFSQEDNQILNLIKGKGTNRYCGAGVATIIYPYKDVLEYCALKWAVNDLDDSWLYLDKVFEVVMNNFEEDKRKGIIRPRPEKGDLFIKNLESAASDENIFLKDVMKQTIIESERGQSSEYKAKLFLNSIESYVTRVLSENADFVAYENSCKIDENKLKMKEQLEREVDRVESQLFNYEAQIKKIIPQIKTFIVDQILVQDSREKTLLGGQDYRLNTWILAKNEPVHPLAARYIMYQIIIEIQKLLYGDNVMGSAGLIKENSDMLSAIGKYRNAYTIEKDDGVTAVERAKKASKQNMFSKVFSKNEVKQFIDDYADKSPKQLKNLNNYKKRWLLELVYTTILKAVKSISDDMERFFENLKDTFTSINNELERRAIEHERNNDSTKVYVLASKDIKDKLWEGIKRSVDKGFLPTDISRQIYVSHYKKYCDSVSTKASGKDNEDSNGVEKVYRENVVEHCRKVLKEDWKDRLDLNLVEALMMEAEMLEKKAGDYLSSKIKELINLSAPFVPPVSRSGAMNFWGVHPICISKMNMQQLQEIFEGKQIEDDAFSKYEIVCYRAVYGLHAQDYPKFSAGMNKDTFKQEPGVYYQAYMRRIDRLNRNKESTVTPHLDKNWHLPAFMPDLNMEQVKLDKENVDKALILGIIYGWLKAVKDEGRAVYQYNASNSSSLIMISGKTIGAQTYQLHRALFYNPIIFTDIIERAMEIKLNEIETIKTSIEEHSFVRGALNVKIVNSDYVNNILDVVFGYPFDALGDSTLEEISKMLISRLLDEIIDYYHSYYGGLKLITANKAAANIIKKLWEESKMQNEIDKETKEYEAWKSIIDNKISELNRG